MKYSYKMNLLYLSTIVMGGKCECQKQELGVTDACNEKLEQLLDKNVYGSKPEEYIKEIIKDTIINGMPLSMEEKKEMFDYYKPLLNTDSKDNTIQSLIKNCAAYTQQHKDLYSKLSPWSKKVVVIFLDKNNSKYTIGNVCDLTTDDFGKELIRLTIDDLKEKEALFINCINNPTIVNKMPEKFQKAIPEGIQKYKDFMKKNIEHMQNLYKKPPKKTLDERFKAMFDGIIFKDWVTTKIENIIADMPLSKEEKKEMLNYYEPLLNTNSKDHTIQSLKQSLDEYAQNIKKYCFELSPDQKEALTALHEKLKGSIPKIYLKLSQDVSKKQSLSELAIEKLKQDQQLLINCISNPAIVNKMSEKFQKAIPDGIRKYKDSIKTEIEEVSKY